MKNEVKIQLRLPIPVRDWFAAYSAGKNRSMNGQMIELLLERMQQEHEEKEKTPIDAGKQ